LRVKLTFFSLCLGLVYWYASMTLKQIDFQNFKIHKYWFQHCPHCNVSSDWVIKVDPHSWDNTYSQDYHKSDRIRIQSKLQTFQAKKWSRYSIIWKEQASKMSKRGNLMHWGLHNFTLKWKNEMLSVKAKWEKGKINVKPNNKTPSLDLDEGFRLGLICISLPSKPRVIILVLSGQVTSLMLILCHTNTKVIQLN
jgi:hypothetical protein